MMRLSAAAIALFALLAGTITVQAGPPHQHPLVITGPALVDAQYGRLYIAAEDGSHVRQTVVVSAGDGSVQSTFAVGGPMALDTARGRLYVSSSTGVVALDSGSGQAVRTLSAIPVKSGWGGGDYLPPVVIPATGEVLVIDGPQLRVFDADGTAPVRTLPFTAEGFTDSAGAPLTPQSIVYDEGREILYGAFLVHAQVSSGIGGSFSAYEIYGLDIKSGKVTSQLEAVDLQQMAIDPHTGHLLVNAGGNARLWSGAGDWSVQLQGAVLAPDQAFQIDATSRRAYAQVQEGPLLALNLDTLELLGFAQLPQDDRLLAFDVTAGQFYLASGDGTLRSMHVSAISDSFASTTGDRTAPQSPVRKITLLPDGQLVAQWADYTVGFSHDNGAHWNTHITGSAALAISPQFPTDQTLLVALDGLGVFRSEDGGMTWRVSSAGLRNISIDWIAFSPTYATDRVVYLYTKTGANPLGYPRTGDLYRSTDGGRSWYALPPRNNGLETITVSDTCGDDCTLTAATAPGAAPGAGAFALSTDGGVTWAVQGNTPAYPVPEGLSLAPLYGKWGVGFIFGNDGVLYRSADGGKNWTPVLTGTPPDVYWGFAAHYAQLAYGPDMESGRPVFLVLHWSESADDQQQPRSALFTSGDGGQTWQRATVPAGRTPTAIAIPDGFVDSGTLYIGLPDGGIATIQHGDLEVQQ